MRGEAAGGGIDAGAVLSGMGLGLMVALPLGLVLGLLIWQVPLTRPALYGIALVCRAVAGVAAGVRAARRAGYNGLLHGLLSGAVLGAVLGLLDVIAQGTPAPADVWQGAGVVLGGATLGGILSVNLRT